jgi:hypothetical protein
MTSLKKHIVYTFLAIFVVTAFVGLSGVIGWVEINLTPLNGYLLCLSRNLPRSS